jgi:hypothetical protein
VQRYDQVADTRALGAGAGGRGFEGVRLRRCIGRHALAGFSDGRMDTGRLSVGENPDALFLDKCEVVADRRGP